MGNLGCCCLRLLGDLLSSKKGDTYPCEQAAASFLVPAATTAPDPAHGHRDRPVCASPCPRQRGTGREGTAKGIKIEREEFQQTEHGHVIQVLESRKDFLSNALLLAHLGLAEITCETGTVTLQEIPHSEPAGLGRSLGRGEC